MTLKKKKKESETFKVAMEANRNVGVSLKTIRIRVAPIAIRSKRGNRGQVGGSARTKSRALRLRGERFSLNYSSARLVRSLSSLSRERPSHTPLLLVRPLPEFPISPTLSRSRFLKRVEEQAARSG